MKSLSLFCTAALSLVCAGSALASTMDLESYGSTASAPAGAVNSATNYLGFEATGTNGSPTGGGSSYNVGTGGVWTSPTGDSSWVSSSPNAYPGGSVSPAAGEYVFQTTFTDLDPSSSGTLTLLADDTASVYLNGSLIEAAANSTPAAHCDVAVPNCITPTTFDLTGLVQGTNTLTIDNFQEHGFAEGIDYSGTITSAAVTPEPSSLLLLATGLLAGGGLIYRRRLLA